MTKPHVLIFAEPPPAAGQPAAGLGLRHARMAACWLKAGARVSWAWPASSAGQGSPPEPPEGCTGTALDAPDELAHWLQRQRPDAIVLGYWEFENWLPRRLDSPLVLDYIAPRLLERQFEDRDRLPGDIARLLPLLARVDEVWVGNEQQRSLMVPLMLLAGHDCRGQVPVLPVPIAGYPADATVVPTASARALKVFHGGRDWPWRQSDRWLSSLDAADVNVERIDASEQAGYGSLEDYRKALDSADLVLDLAEDNLERRYSQSFRVTDALCAGVPVVVNRFLPLADVIEQSGAGWVIDAPEELPTLLQAIVADRAQLEVRAGNARKLAGARFSVDRVYRPLLDRLTALTPPESPREPLIGASADSAPGMRRVLVDYLRQWVHQRLRLPFHRWVGRRLANRPLPESGREAWVVVSRPDVFPTDHGAAVKIERTAWGLSFHIGEVLLLTDRRDGYWRYCRGEREFHRFPLALRLPGWPRAVNLMRLMARGLPYSNAFLYLPLVDRGIHLRLMWLLSRYPVEVVQGEFPAYAHPAVWSARLFGTKSVLVEHNVEYLRIAEQVPELSDSARHRLKSIEVDLANACDRVITVSDADRERLVQAGVQPGRLRTVPHGVDLEAFDHADPVDLRSRFDIPSDHLVLVYHGIYSYPPNLAAVEELSEAILPKLKSRGCPAHVVAFGPEPPDAALPGVTFAGAVKDLAAHLKGGDLAVIPLRSGGGTRMKILDDFAAGVPVISTTKGAEGIPVEHGRELLVVDEAEALVDAVIELHDHPDRARALAERARAWVAAFDWRAIAARYVASLRRS